MRVIAGSAKSMPLKTIPGVETRPTTDRIKETLFNMLQPYLCECRFLDLFAGSGGIGIEALSRGADFCTFIEKNKRAVSVIEDNLRFTRLQERAQVLGCDVFFGLAELRQEDAFDCIFMDPPYGKEWEKKVLEVLKYAPYVTEDTLIVVEASLDTTFDYLEEYGFQVIREKKYKTNQHVFVKKQSRKAEAW